MSTISSIFRLAGTRLKFGNSPSNFVQVSFIHQGTNPIGDPRGKIGNREVVGYGINGQWSYVDHVAHPFPAIRFKEDTPDISVLREKEKGDWKKLSIEEKKTLYRASFCQTYAEMEAPDGQWKQVIGMGLIFISAAFWLFIGCKYFVYPPMPDSLTLENRQKQLRKMIDIKVDPVDGISSKWDYENNRWKK